LSGYRNSDGSFGYQGSDIAFWSSTAIGPNAWFRNLHYNYAVVWRNLGPRTLGFSVRGIKN
jgi:hypothetical protein